jgi:hypothetical protein
MHIMDNLSGSGKEDLRDIYHDILEVTMHLVSALILMNQRSQSTTRSNNFRAHLATWYEGVQKTWQHVKPKGNCHATFHVWDFIQLFAPAVFWWCYSFERLIGHMERLPHNHTTRMFSFVLTNAQYTEHPKVESEQTIVGAFTLGCRTRHWLSRPDCPDAIKKCKELYDSAYRKTDAVPVNEDSVDPSPLSPGKRKPIQLESRLASQLNIDHAIVRCYYPHLNVYFSPSETHLGNSLVTFRLPGDPQEQIRYGSIQLIYWDDGSGWKFVIRQQCPKPPQSQDSIHDIFAEYPDFPAQMCLVELTDEIDVIKVDDIVGHYARWDWSEDYCAVLRLDKVVDVILLHR